MAYQKGLSSLNASFNLQELTFHHVEKGGTVNVILLDSVRAFDTVPHDGLRLKLYEYETTAKLWLLLDNMYMNLTSAVLCDGQLSDWFMLNRGVRQGSVLSAKLYLIFINDLIDELESSKCGAYLHDLSFNSPVQADDISIIATSRQSSQAMINICERYSVDWSFTFSSTKSQHLQFGKQTTGQDLCLYDNPIPCVTTAKHVGVTLYSNLKTMDRTLNVCRTLRASVASIIRLGVHPAVLNPIVCAKIVKQVCYPKALYGCELWGKISSTEILMLERSHHYICKNIQGLPRKTRTDMCLPMLGWFSMESYIDEKKLLFFGRVCCLPNHAVSYRILIRRLNDAKYNDGGHPNIGFLCDILDILQKYKLSAYLDTFIQNASFPPKPQWKRIVKTAITDTEILSWKVRMNNSGDFSAFKFIQLSYSPHPAWTIAKNYPYLRKHAHFLISVCCLIRDDECQMSTLCDRCGKLFADPIVHAISACDFLDDVRDMFWCEFFNINPLSFSVFLGNMSEFELCLYLLSCKSNYFELDSDQEELFQQICVRYIYRFGTLYRRLQ